MPASARALVHAFLEREFIRQVEFLAELVRVPSDNPARRLRPGRRARARVAGRACSIWKWKQTSCPQSVVESRTA